MYACLLFTGSLTTCIFICLQVYSYGQTAHSHGSDPVVFETGGKFNPVRGVEDEGQEGRVRVVEGAMGWRVRLGGGG